jgi:patatin-like phospholipase/acyl hydrolase
MFRILCLDGGGIKGVFTAAALARIEDQTKSRIVDHFDLICGTSTGGIIAVGLAMGLSAQTLLDFYRERGPHIFPTMGLVGRTFGILRQLFVGPKLSHAILRRELHSVLGDSRFGEARCRLAIPSYDAVRSRIYVFKTPHHPRFVNDRDTFAVDVALATSAAPTYFAAASTQQGGRFVDGGVWANSPVMVALVEAVSFLNVPLADIDLLTIGTTTEPFSIAKNEAASALKWNIGLVDLMFEAQSEAAQAQVGLLLDGRVHRINFQSTANRFSLDNANETAIADLTNLGRTEVERKVHTEVIVRRFVNGVAAAKYKPLER